MCGPGLPRTVAVRERTGRHRYIAFEVEAPEPPSAQEVIQALRRQARNFPREVRPWLVLMEGRRGLLRCAHTHKEEAIMLLRSLGASEALGHPVRTLGTSGTIRKAKKRYLAQGSGRGATG
jgi:RNase P/RNase MRP subunit POP5